MWQGDPPFQVHSQKHGPVRQAVGGGCQSGWGRLLSVTNAVEAGTWRQGDSGWAYRLGALEGGWGGLPPFQCNQHRTVGSSGPFRPATGGLREASRSLQGPVRHNRRRAASPHHPQFRSPSSPGKPTDIAVPRVAVAITSKSVGPLVQQNVGHDPRPELLRKGGGVLGWGSGSTPPMGRSVPMRCTYPSHTNSVAVEMMMVLLVGLRL